MFRHLHTTYPQSIVMIQETHSCPNIVNVWKSEWGGPIAFAHGPDTTQAGVAIMFPSGYSGCISEVHSDREGRLLCLELDSASGRLLLISVYAPTGTDQKKKCEFLDSFRNILLAYSNCRTLVGGDFNIKLMALDSDNSGFTNTRSVVKLNNILDEFDLVDVWRMQHPTTRRFTWRRISPFQQSRIDFIFASNAIFTNEVMRSRIDAGILSDHNVTIVNADLSTEKRGPGIWRFNNELLHCETFVDSVRQECADALTGIGCYAGDIKKGVKLEMLLSSVRVKAIIKSKEIANVKRAEEKELHSTLNVLETKLADNPSGEVVSEYERAKNKLDQLKIARGKFAMLCTQSKWREEGERSTKYFLRLANRRSAESNMSAIETEDGRVIRGNSAILKECVKYFRSLYASKQCSTGFSSFALDDNDPRLSEEDRLECEGPVTKEECQNALTKMARNKASGISGFSAEFFSFFWLDLGELIVDYYNDAKERNELFVTHRRGILTLIPKKGDQKLLKNKRPICLLDVIYKLLAKVMANRLSKVIDKIVHEDQTGFIKGRYIGENLRLVSDIITYCNMDNLPGLLLAVDYRNAFDSLEHEFMWFTLESFNFGPSFCSWIKLLYTGAQLAVKNNGFTSEWFPSTRGTFQGSPLSGLLFNLAAELLAIRIRKTRNINGIEISKVEVKLSQYADDLTLFLKNEDSLMNAFEVIEEFGNASGLQVNDNKTKLMWLGADRGERKAVRNIEASSKLKILGVWFSATEQCTDDNINPVVNKIKNVTNSWSQRSLTIKGRITIVKSLLISQFVFIAITSKIPNADIKQIDSHIMRFLWRGRPPKVARSTLRQRVKDGGLNATDTSQLYDALRLTWISRMCKKADSTWCKLVQRRIGSFQLRDLLRSDRAVTYVNQLNIPHFYKEVIITFQRVMYASVDSAVNARRQLLWFNDEIKRNKRPFCIYPMYRAGVRFLDDIIGSNGNMLTCNEFRNKYPQIAICSLRYLGLKSAIPATWKRLILESPNESMRIEEKDQFKLCFGKSDIAVESVKSRHFYNKLVGTRIPTAQEKWEQEGYTNLPWSSIYEMPYKCCASTKLQSLQYRVINRYIPTRKFLCTREVVGSPLCLKCFEVDNFEHFFYHCRDVRSIWEHVLSQLKNKFALQDDFDSVQTVLFGYPSAPLVVNLIILLVKQYVVTNKLNQGQSNYLGKEGAIEAIAGYIRIEKNIAMRRDKMIKFREKWSKISDSNGDLLLR